MAGLDGWTSEKTSPGDQYNIRRYKYNSASEMHVMILNQYKYTSHNNTNNVQAYNSILYINNLLHSGCDTVPLAWYNVQVSNKSMNTTTVIYN